MIFFFFFQPKVTNVWLVNLAVADLIFCLTRLLSVVYKFRSNNWPFGSFFCKFNGFFKYANMFCSVFLLAVISLDRALCVWRPVFTKRRRTLLVARIVAVCVWTLAVIFSTPYFIYREISLDEENKTKCSIDKGDKRDAKSSLYCIRFLCGFLLPFMVILVCYILAGVGIKRTRLSGKSRPLRILATLVIAFFLCWAPYHCLLLVKMVDSQNQELRNWQRITSSIAYFNSCVNPLLYYCVGMKVKGGLRQRLPSVYRKAMTDVLDENTNQMDENSRNSQV